MSRECENQMTLGGLIERLKQLDEQTIIKCGKRLDSYRGYYEDLAIEPSETGVNVVEFIKACEEADGETFTGYKGGDFTMDLDTPIFVAYYGSTGSPLKNIANGGELEVFKYRGWE